MAFFRKYRVTGFKAEFAADRIQLTEKQAAPRMTCLEQKGKDIYEITGHIEFCAGEIIGLPAGVVPSLFVCEPVEGKVPEAKAPEEQKKPDETEKPAPDPAPDPAPASPAGNGGKSPN